MSELKPIIFGEVLLDLFPDGNKVLGGAPFNIAWYLQGFGLTPLLISRVGNDEDGKNIITVMKSWDMDITGIQFDALHPTGRVNVEIKNNEPSYDIQENCAYDFIDSQNIDSLPKRCLFYHGTLALRYKHNRQVLKYLYSQLLTDSQSSLFIDINLRAPWYNLATLSSILKNADYLKLNADELTALSKNSVTQDVQTKAFSLKASLKVNNMLITQGASGALMIDHDEKLYQTHPTTNDKVIDTVGAGDAFSSIIMLGHLKNWSAETTLKRAQEFASSILSQQGATMNNTSLYNYFKDIWMLQ